MSIEWDQDALESVNRAPALLRGMVRRRVESHISGLGRDRVTLADVQEARSRARGGGPDEYGGMKPEDIEKMVAESKNPVVSNSRFYEVLACGGAQGCPRALYDVDSLARKMTERIEASSLPAAVEARVKGPVLRHHKFSVAISGCPNSCSQPQIHDFGLQGRTRVEVTDQPCTGCMACVAACRESAVTVDGTDVTLDHDACIDCGDCAAACPTGTIESTTTGFSVLMGGKLGRHPQLSREIIRFASEEQALAALDVAVEIFCSEMREGERMADAVTRIGVDEIWRRLQ